MAGLMTETVAVLDMYDPAPLRAANDRLWARVRDGLRARGLAAPDSLTRGAQGPWPAWTAPGLVLGQTCGFPYRARLHGAVTLIATPDHRLPGCPPGHYRSIYVVRADDRRAALAEFDGARLAYNEAMSQSGWAAPMNDCAARGLALRAGPETGSHLASAQAVAEGRADLAAIDAVTWAILTQNALDPPGLRVLDATAPTPALPYIAAAGADAAATRAALSEAVADLAPADRAALHLHGLVHLEAAAYLAVPTPPPPEAPAGA